MSTALNMDKSRILDLRKNQSLWLRVTWDDWRRRIGGEGKHGELLGLLEEGF